MERRGCEEGRGTQREKILGRISSFEAAYSMWRAARDDHVTYLSCLRDAFAEDLDLQVTLSCVQSDGHPYRVQILRLTL